jgi:hypothetical protein
MFVLSTAAAKKRWKIWWSPDLALVDTEYRDVIWVDAKHPQGGRTILDQMGETEKRRRS